MNTDFSIPNRLFANYIRILQTQITEEYKKNFDQKKDIDLALQATKVFAQRKSTALQQEIKKDLAIKIVLRKTSNIENELLHSNVNLWRDIILIELELDLITEQLTKTAQALQREKKKSLVHKQQEQQLLEGSRFLDDRIKKAEQDKSMHDLFRARTHSAPPHMEERPEDYEEMHHIDALKHRRTTAARQSSSRALGNLSENVASQEELIRLTETATQHEKKQELLLKQLSEKLLAVQLPDNYTPQATPTVRPSEERKSLEDMIKQTEERIAALKSELAKSDKNSRTKYEALSTQNTILARLYCLKTTHKNTSLAQTLKDHASTIAARREAQQAKSTIKLAQRLTKQKTSRSIFNRLSASRLWKSYEMDPKDQFKKALNPSIFSWTNPVRLIHTLSKIYDRRISSTSQHNLTLAEVMMGAKDQDNWDYYQKRLNQIFETIYEEKGSLSALVDYYHQFNNSTIQNVIKVMDYISDKQAVFYIAESTAQHTKKLILEAANTLHRFIQNHSKNLVDNPYQNLESIMPATEYDFKREGIFQRTHLVMRYINIKQDGANLQVTPASTLRRMC